MGTSVPSQ